MKRFCLILVLIAVAWGQDYQPEDQGPDKLNVGDATYCGKRKCDDDLSVCLARFQGPHLKSQQCMKVEQCKKSCDETDECCCYLPGIHGGKPPSNCIDLWREDIEGEESIKCFTSKGVKSLETFPELIPTHCRISKNGKKEAGRSDVKCRKLYKKGGCCCNLDECNETLEECLKNPYIPELPQENPESDS